MNKKTKLAILISAVAAVVSAVEALQPVKAATDRQAVVIVIMYFFNAGIVSSVTCASLWFHCF